MLPLSTCVSVWYIHVYVCRSERDREELGHQSPQGVVAGGIHPSLSSLSVIILVLFRLEWDGQC